MIFVNEIKNHLFENEIWNELQLHINLSSNMPQMELKRWRSRVGWTEEVYLAIDNLSLSLDESRDELPVFLAYPSTHPKPSPVELEWNFCQILLLEDVTESGVMMNS